MPKPQTKDASARSSRARKGRTRLHEPSRQEPGTLSVRLTRKFADVIDGVNITDAHVGDRLDLPQHDAEVLIAEGWAERTRRRSTTSTPQHSLAADEPRRKKPVKR